MNVLQKIKNKKAISLTELLVSSFLIGIVILGIIGFTSTVKRMEQTTTNSAVLSMQVHAAMTEVTKEATLAVGNPENPGIEEFDDGSSKTICFRQDIEQTPSDYSDDDWRCLWYNNATKTLYKCPFVSPAQISCDIASAEFIIKISDKNFYNVVYEDGRMKHIEFTIETLSDVEKAEDPITNPSYSITSEVNPPMHSR